MKKRLILLVLASLVLMATACQKDGNTEGKPEGKEECFEVWRVTKETVYGKEPYTETYEYDEYGNQILRVKTDSDGNEIERTDYHDVYEYDSEGRLLRIKNISTIPGFASLGPLSYEFRYDEQGRRVEAINYIPLLGDYVEKIVSEIEYFDGGCRVVSYKYFTKDSLEGKDLAKSGIERVPYEETEYNFAERRWTRYTLSLTGKEKEEETVYNERGDKRKFFLKGYYDEEYVYNDYGRLIEIIGSAGERKSLLNDSEDVYDDTGKLCWDYEYYVNWEGKHLRSAEEYIYDDADRVAEVRLYKVSGREEKLNEVPSERRTYTYDSADRVLTETKYDKNDRVSQKTEYTYDSAGNQLSETIYNGNGNITYRKEQEWKCFRCKLEMLIPMDWNARMFDLVQYGK